MMPVLINSSRFVLRDFTEEDRTAFVAYQMDPRYLALYDFNAADVDRPNILFDLFRAWSGAEPRRSFQLGIFDGRTDMLCGCAGLRITTDSQATMGIELASTE